ncbi:hypothetical protein KFE25_001984 [Diacronema lutheri]|uniref:DUF924 domain-containing protein n=1 Tax=Diacronema lutheri TaxID=2081491 RepID=A0A8J5XK98_DIALT|nr:hypothetical protein KFE25_001984 [Diacronema lutheri]
MHVGGACFTALSVALRRPFASRSAPGMSGASPEQVLRFWFGAEWFDGGYDAPAYERERVRFWFMGGAAVDVQCREFIPRIRKAGRGELHGEEWKSRDGLVAQLVLLDQFSRNAFRGAPEAFAYDARAVAVALQLIDKAGDRPASVPFKSKIIERQLDVDLPEHMAVVKKFGRYPHRNGVYGRETTPAEAAWLASDEAPGWSKSQQLAKTG